MVQENTNGKNAGGKTVTAHQHAHQQQHQQQHQQTVHHQQHQQPEHKNNWAHAIIINVAKMCK